ncbi:MAG: phosphate signaling complex protein PhoU [Chloroflexi bacterium]|nr:phosphate signaling complex protein PhoU [Chloroflexota bacterium]
MRTQFNLELDKIRDSIRQLGALANIATARAVNALINHDYAQAREVKREDRSTDQLRYDIENACLTVIATQQPVARDLRELVAATLVAVELERCGDYAKGIAKSARRITRANAQVSSYNLPEMDTLARNMLERCVNAFVTIDVATAQAVIADDNRIDQLYNELVAGVTTDMTASATHIEGGTWLLHAGHCLERLADRATNIAERVLFIDSGDLVGDMNVHRIGEARKI